MAARDQAGFDLILDIGLFAEALYDQASTRFTTLVTSAGKCIVHPLPLQAVYATGLVLAQAAAGHGADAGRESEGFFGTCSGLC